MVFQLPPAPHGPVRVPLHHGPEGRLLFCGSPRLHSSVPEHLDPSPGGLGLAPTSELRPTWGCGGVVRRGPSPKPGAALAQWPQLSVWLGTHLIVRGVQLVQLV